MFLTKVQCLFKIFYSDVKCKFNKMHKSKKKRRRKELKELQNPKTINKMVTSTYILIITLNVNGLNAPAKKT